MLERARDIVNHMHPGWAQAMEVPATDHVLNRFETELESFRNFPKGTFNPAVIEVMKKWADEVNGG